MTTYQLTLEYQATNYEKADEIAQVIIDRAQDFAAVGFDPVATFSTEEIERYKGECYESGDVPCIDPQGHDWIVSDENENDCYCTRCGCREY